MDQIGLVERARRGDRHAFADLIRASGARLDATARLILRDPDLAQDAVQETLIRAWRSLPGLRDPASFDHWLHSLVVNACIDLIRRRRKRRVIEVDVGPSPSSPPRRHRTDCRPRPARPGAGPARARSPGCRRPPFLSRSPAPAGRGDARDPGGHREVAPPPLPRRDALVDGDRRGDLDRRLAPAIGGPVG